MSETRIAAMPGTRRLAIALFACLILLFGLLAQANLWFHVGEGGPPGPTRVLWKYHGKPGSTKLHQVLDPALAKDAPKAMWPFLGANETQQAQARSAILSWVDAGAPASGWDGVSHIFRGGETCGQCHVPGGQKQDLPFETYEQVLPVAKQDEGIAWGTLFVTAHNHFFAFAVASLLLTLLLTFTGLRGLPRVLLILAAFAGPVIDVGCWFLTKLHGEPWHLGVMLGGALFGGTIAAMALVVLWEAVLAKPGTPPA